MQCNELRVLVTGAASGLGRACALALARLGASVAAMDIDRPGLEALKREARDAGADIAIVEGDVTQETQVAAVVAAAASTLGTLNALINSAGICRDGRLVAAHGATIRRLPLTQ